MPKSQRPSQILWATQNPQQDTPCRPIVSSSDAVYTWVGQGLGLHLRATGRTFTMSHQKHTNICWWNRAKPSGLKKKNILLPMMYKPFLHLYLWPLPSLSFNISWNKTLNYTTELPCSYITSLHFCSSFQNTYFLFQGKSFEKVHGAAMGSPISSIEAFIEDFEIKAINTSTKPPRIWLRYVDDIFVIVKAEHSHQFLQHINSIDPHIQFTAETPNADGSIPFLDSLVSPGPDNTLLTTLHGKPILIDQYLHWDSHYNIIC